MLQLVDAKRKIWQYEGREIPLDDDSNHWTLILIKSVARVDWRNMVTAEFIGSEEEKLIYFTFDSTDELVRIGDIISLRHLEISVFDMDKMQPRKYKITIFENDKFSNDEFP